MFCTPELPPLVSALGFYALAQRIHQVDHIRSSGLPWALDLLSFLLFAKKLLERVLVLVLKFLWLKIGGSLPLGMERPGRQPFIALAEAAGAVWVRGASRPRPGA